ncbi:hypothetical protein GCM10010246_18160 [Streptomyces cuspidosporus]|uniref:Uncharacterized protein n=1 Tax=Streptomyces cuspidosporus TaxID=66882 RepID=A0ABP5SM98_9ACTN
MSWLPRVSWRGSPAERAQQAWRIIREAGYEPLEPWPGKATVPWRCRCITCKRVRHPTVSGVLQDRCQHVRPEQPPPRSRAAP